MKTPTTDAVHAALAAFRQIPPPTSPSRVRMHLVQQMMLDNEGLQITIAGIAAELVDGEDLDQIFKLPRPRTLAGMPIIIDLSLPEDVIVFEDGAGKELSRITGLPGPKAYDG